MSRSRKKYPHWSYHKQGISRWVKRQASKKVRRAGDFHFENRGTQSIKKFYDSWNISDYRGVTFIDSPEKFFKIIKRQEIELKYRIRPLRSDKELWREVFISYGH